MRSEDYERHGDLFPRREQSMALCAECTLCQQSGLGFTATEVIWGNGPRDARLMIVGKDSAGGDQGEPLWKGSRYTLMPLTNKKTGAKLRILLDRAGIDPFSVFITNTVKCNLGYDERGLTYAQLARVCIQHLREEMADVRPQVVLTLGEGPAKAVRRVLEFDKPLVVDALKPAEMLSDCPAFVGHLRRLPPSDAGPSQTQVFNLKHPSYVEGEARESLYIRNLEVIAARLR